VLPKKVTKVKVPPPPPAKQANIVDNIIIPALRSIPEQTPELVQLGKAFQELEQKSPGTTALVMKALAAKML
jgi:hypothetical protein